MSTRTLLSDEAVLVTVPQAKRLLNLNDALDQAIRDRELKVIVLGKRWRRLRYADLMAWVEERSNRGPDAGPRPAA